MASTATARGKRDKETVTTATVGGKRGIDVLHDPVLNKATAYTEEERQALGLVGLVPDVTESEDLQLRRVLQQLGHKTTDLDRYIYLVNLLDNDETLFYRTVMSDPARFLPIVYDPTIAEACLKFGHIYRRARGMYLSITRKGHVKDVLRNWPVQDVRVICVTFKVTAPLRGSTCFTRRLIRRSSEYQNSSLMTTSLPVPLSPVISTEASEPAICWASLTTFAIDSSR